MMPGPAPVTTIQSAAARRRGEVAGEDVHRVVGPGARRAEHGELADVAVGPEDPEGLAPSRPARRWRSSGRRPTCPRGPCRRAMPTMAWSSPGLRRRELSFSKRASNARRACAAPVPVPAPTPRSRAREAWPARRAWSAGPGGDRAARRSPRAPRRPCAGRAWRRPPARCSRPSASPRGRWPRRESTWRAPSAPILTQLTWMLSMSPR